MTKRIIAYGCSNTFGESLEDCWHPDTGHGPTPSKYAWPQIIANELNRECVNLARPGVSNKFIANSVLENHYDKDDVVIILWTFFTRYCFFQDDNSINHIGIGYTGKDSLNKEHKNYNQMWFTKFYQEKDCMLDNYTRMSLCKYHLDSLGIPNFHYTCDKWEHHRDAISQKFTPPFWSQVQVFPDVSIFGDDTGLDGRHPGPISHKDFAEKVIEKDNLRQYENR